MSLASWKTFNFFDVSQVKPPDDEESLGVLERNDISCVCSGSDNVFLGSSDGVVRILSRTFKVVRTFQAHETGSITHMKQVEGTSLLVTIAEDLSSEPVLRVWALNKPDKKTGIPKCQVTLSIQNGRKQFPISAFAILDDLSQVAVGFANGAVTVVRGDLINDLGAKQRTVFESEEPITGVGFRDGSKITTLYISTTARLLTLVISGKGQRQPARTLEETGCAVGCMTVDKRNGDIVVARDDAIYFYRPPGRGPVYAHEGPKNLISLYDDYTVLVSPPQSSGLAKSSGLGRFRRTQTVERFSTSTFTILDTDLKFIAHSEALSSPVKGLFVEWGDLFVLTLDGKLYRYHEKDLLRKLEILYQRNLYVLAINLAQKAGMNALEQNVIYRKYADFLYSKGDFDGAMQQYLKAIANTEPSQVIRKFLDTQRINHLIEYLEELHDHHMANADHTTLLLNCYAKLKDVDKLEAFIKSPGDLKFDLDIAISMCRQGGYYRQAVYLATKHEEHDLVLTILVEDSKEYAEALEYIWLLEPEVVYRNLMKYAMVLLEHCPAESTKLFIDYFTGAYTPRRNVSEVVDAQSPQSVGTTAIQTLTSLIPLPYSTISNTTSPPGPTGQAADSTAQDAEARSVEQFPYETPKPRKAFSSFVDHPDCFAEFLQACLVHGELSGEDKADVVTTLFEMYLHFAQESRYSERENWSAKARKLIDGGEVLIDSSNILLLSHLSQFPEGTTLVREKQGLQFDIFRSYTSANDTAGAIKALRKYGKDEPQLYPAALAYFTSSPKVLEEAGEEVRAVLRKIDKDGLMAPLEVIQTLSANDVATVGLVKRYLGETIEKERREISNNRRLIESYRTETEAKRKEIDELGSKPVVFQATRCSACGGTLDLPTVHFLCKHSFHQRCLDRSDENAECPVCASQNATVRAIRRAQEESAERHDIFKEALSRSRDKFGTISEFFGRGIMTTPTIDHA